MIIGAWNMQGISTKQRKVFQQLQKFNLDMCAIKKNAIYPGISRYFERESRHTQSGVSVATKKKYKN